jgi:hypothetical protein
MAVDPARDLLLATDHANQRLVAIDPSEPSGDAVALVAAGMIEKISPYAQLQYANNLQRLIYYSAHDGAALYSIAAPSASSRRKLVESPWQWQSQLNAANNLDPIADAASFSQQPINRDHVFGRFRVANYDSIDLAILVRHTDSPVYAIRLS